MTNSVTVNANCGFDPKPQECYDFLYSQLTALHSRVGYRMEYPQCTQYEIAKTEWTGSWGYSETIRAAFRDDCYANTERIHADVTCNSCYKRFYRKLREYWADNDVMDPHTVTACLNDPESDICLRVSADH